MLPALSGIVVLATWRLGGEQGKDRRPSMVPPLHGLCTLLPAAFPINLRSRVLVLTDPHWLCDVGQVASLL